MTTLNRPPIGEAESKKVQVEAMFDAIAPRYDLLNRVLSFGIDQYWRRRAISMLKPTAPRTILDVATGTADLAIQALRLRPERVVGVDLSEEMIRVGSQKLSKLGLDGIVRLEKGDSEHLPFPDASFDAAMVAFGVRNFENLSAGLSEIYRVLKPGGMLVVLEFSKPRAFPIKQLYGLYSKHVIPRIGRSVSKDDGAYSYLPESVAAFPDGPRFQAVMQKCGYSDLVWKPLTFGIASLYGGTKPATSR